MCHPESDVGWEQRSFNFNTTWLHPFTKTGNMLFWLSQCGEERGESQVLVSLPHSSSSCFGMKP
jgi:hypothetical protein